MNDEIERPKVQADNNSIAIGEINITGTVTGDIRIGHTIIQAADARLRHDLGILLKNVETTWIKGVLEKSIHEAALLELGMEVREEAVDNPWRMVIERPDQSREVLPQGRKIKDIFEEANHLLLILGEPGSGKTTTLLQLARDLIAAVDEAFTQPIPVILHLSTWTDKQQPLDEWLINELNSKYRLPKRDGKKWLQDCRILPLLDGLDEVKVENRAACVEKINQLVVDYGLQGLMVCSRIKDYTDLNVRLAFYRAIYIQPLTLEQVDEYFEKAGDKLSSLRSTLQDDESLRSMAQSPLILNIMSLAYQNASAKDLSDPALATNQVRRRHLFDTYVARMFNRKAGEQEFASEQTKNYLSWLAQNMQQHNQEIFLIEGLQPNWLSGNLWQWVYILSSRLVPLLIVFIILMPIIGILASEFSSESFIFIWVVTPIIFLLYGLVNGLSFGLEVKLKFRQLMSKLNLRLGIIKSNFITEDGLPNRYAEAYRWYRNLKNDIQTVEALHWSFSNALRGGLFSCLASSLLICTSLGLVFVADLSDGILYGLIFASFLGLLIGLLGTILSGLSRGIAETKSTPNEGIHLSTKNSVLVGLISGSIVGLTTGVLVRLISTPNVAIYSGVIVGLIFGFMSARYYGGLDVVQHYILRLILIIQGYTPAYYARFLDYAVDLIFLQKVGGGYRFIHRLLLEHFADMDETTKRA
jgi:hypothetical protein